MDLKQRPLSNLFSRNVLTDLGLRSSLPSPKIDKPFFNTESANTSKTIIDTFPKSCWRFSTKMKSLIKFGSIPDTKSPDIYLFTLMHLKAKRNSSSS
jgi:hypothetical protein